MAGPEPIHIRSLEPEADRFCQIQLEQATTGPIAGIQSGYPNFNPNIDAVVARSSWIQFQFKALDAFMLWVMG